MTPREELLAAIKILDVYLGVGETGPETRIVRDWLQLEADQHWRPLEADVLAGTGVYNKWDQPWWTEEMLALQPCIQMARLINGTEGL